MSPVPPSPPGPSSFRMRPLDATGPRRMSPASMRLFLPSVLLLPLAFAAGAAAQPAHFAACAANTGESATVVFPAGADASVNGVPLAAGDEVAVFTPGGHCAGAVVWPGSGLPFAFPVWGDDPMTPGRDGLRTDEPLQFRLWLQEADEEVGVTPSWVEAHFRPCGSVPGPCRDSGTYAASVLFVVESVDGHTLTTGTAAPDAAGVRVGPVAPNPAGATAYISLELDREQHVVVEVLDTLGRRVTTVHDGVRAAGDAAPLAIDASGLPGGVYLLHVRGTHFVRTLRFVRR
jgi:hypothetical protein